MADSRKWKMPKAPPAGRVDKPFRMQHHKNRDWRIDKKRQRAFEGKSMPYCVYSSAHNNGKSPVTCFKKRSQAESEMRSLEAVRSKNFKDQQASCDVDEAALRRWERGTKQLNVPKTHGSLRDAALALKKQLDDAFVKKWKVLKLCRENATRWYGPVKRVVRQYKRGSKTKLAMRNPRSWGATHRSNLRKQAAKKTKKK
jgi:hypothetical protein